MRKQLEVLELFIYNSNKKKLLERLNLKIGVEMSKVKKELKEFLEYKKNYKFVQKELIVKDQCIYCEDILLKDIDRK